MDQREIWDDLVGDAWVRNADIIDQHSAPFGEAATERLGTVAGASVLDVGCGTGTTTRELARRGAAAVGIDLSARMVAHARTLNAADRCDRCGAQAYVRVELSTGGELLFCAHHAREHADKLQQVAASIQDETGSIDARKAVTTDDR